MAATTLLPVTLLSTLRIAVGSASFLVPGFTCQTLMFAIPNSSLLAVRLFGCRDAILGLLLHTAKTPEARRRALLAGIAVDALDITAAAIGYFNGEIDAKPVVTFGGGAMSFLILAGLGWKGAVKAAVKI
ncbi:hypothetical protein F5884DRAFT_787753 [Xylogone sp. PMI_703]|nr:hypothetical protein F5884DRAFT_787753 [Xylogone sp. PMI_703]